MYTSRMELAHFEAFYPEESRFAEIEKIIALVKKGKSCQLIGLPGVGRGTLLELLVYNKKLRLHHLQEHEKWFHFVLVNFSEMRGKDQFAVTKFLFLSLLESLRQRGWKDSYEEINALFKECLSMNDELVLFHGLTHTIDYLAIEEELTIIFLFDRFEEYIPYVTPEFFANLRILRQHAKYRFSVVFSLNKSLEDLLEPGLFSEFYEFLTGNTVFMDIADMPGVNFRLDYLEKLTGKKVSKAMREEIISLTAGHGKLTKLAAEACIIEDQVQTVIPSRVKRRRGISHNVDDKDSSAVLGMTKLQTDLQSFLLKQKTVEGGLKEIWRSFSPAEQLWILGKNRTEENDATAQYLQNIHLIEKGSVMIPLFAKWLDQEIHTIVNKKEKIEFDQDTNTIRKGKLILSDDLTASEFRLLSYLLHNPEQVIDRNTIVDVVWGENKSTAGVTEQALDQLILRVRKKIEEEPASPSHLQTVKGRGFKFSP